MSTSGMKTGHKVALAVLLVLGVGDLLVLNLVVAPRYLQQREAAAAGVEKAPVTLARADPKGELEEAEPVKKPEPHPGASEGGEDRRAPEPEPVKKPEPEPVKKPEPEPVKKPEPVKPPPPPPLPNLPDLRFPTGSSELSAQARRALDRAVKALKARAGQRVFVHGHADERGAEATNDRLSRLRAAAVARYLVSRGVAQGRVKLRSHGATRPVDRSNTAEAWDKNRRVEIKWK